MKLISFRLVSGVSKLLAKYDDNRIIKIPYNEEENVVFFDIFLMIIVTIELIIIIKIEEFLENNPKIMEIVNILSSKNIFDILFSFFMTLNIH